MATEISKYRIATERVCLVCEGDSPMFAAIQCCHCGGTGKWTRCRNCLNWGAPSQTCVLCGHLCEPATGVGRVVEWS